MTDLEIPLDEGIRRDQWQRYLIVPPGGRKPKGHTRATTVAKVLDGQAALMPWNSTMSMTGMMRRPGLRARFEALMAQHPHTGPWYGSEASKAECKKLVSECAEAGGRTDAADIGTALHSIIRQANVGQQPLLVQSETTADFEAYRATIAGAGLVIDPQYCEAMIVVDRWLVAGMSDMLRITVPGYGDVVGDLKTAQTLDWSWQPNSIQLAIYAHGDAVYRQGAAVDGSEDERLAMPRVSQERALIIHLPSGQATCTLHWVDIEAGWIAFEHAMWTRDWRNRKDLHEPFTPRRPAVTPRQVPDEGGTVGEAEVEAMRKAYGRLNDGAAAWATATMVAGNDGVLPWNRLSTVPTVRRYELYRGVGALARWADPDSDASRATLDEVVRAIVGLVADDDTAQFPTSPPGLLLGTLDATGAARFAEIAAAVADDRYALVADEASGLLTLEER